MLSYTSLLGIKITISFKQQILNFIENYLRTKQQKPLTIVTPNPEQIVEAQNNSMFRVVLNSADIALPDGVGVVWAIRRVKNNELRIMGKNSSSTRDSLFNIPNSITQIPGIDFMEDLVTLAAKHGWPVALIGGWRGIAQRALEKLQKRYPGLTGWVEEPPEFRIMNDESRIKGENADTHNSLFIIHNSTLSLNDYFNQLVKRIKETHVKVVFVGLGAPKQELFIEELRQYLNQESGIKSQGVKTYSDQTMIYNSYPMILMSVGGAFDEISGRIPRCPVFISDLGFKWLWRLVWEPWRVGRQLRLIKFVWLVLRARMNGKI